MSDDQRKLLFFAFILIFGLSYWFLIRRSKGKEKDHKSKINLLLKITITWFIVGFMIGWGINIFIPNYYKNHIYDWTDFVSIGIPFFLTLILLPIAVIQNVKSKLRKVK